MSGREVSVYRPELERVELLSMATATIGSMAVEDIQRFTVGLNTKSEKLLSLVRDREEFSDEDVRTYFGSFLQSRRHSSSIAAENSMQSLTAALKSLRVSRMEPSSAIQRFTSLKGAPHGVLEDVAFESLHFINPDIYGLCTRWVFNPGTGKGALAAAVRGQVPADFASRQDLLREAKRILDESGFSSQGFYTLDLACALSYASSMIGAKDTSMNSGGMEALFPNSSVLAAMILGIRREIIAHT